MLSRYFTGNYLHPLRLFPKREIFGHKYAYGIPLCVTQTDALFPPRHV